MPVVGKESIKIGHTKRVVEVVVSWSRKVGTFYVALSDEVMSRLSDDEREGVHFKDGMHMVKGNTYEEARDAFVKILELIDEGVQEFTWRKMLKVSMKANTPTNRPSYGLRSDNEVSLEYRWEVVWIVSNGKRSIEMSTGPDDTKLKDLGSYFRRFNETGDVDKRLMYMDYSEEAEAKLEAFRLGFVNLADQVHTLFQGGVKAALEKINTPLMLGTGDTKQKK